MNELFLGLDVGTQGTKGLLVDAASQRVVARAAHPYGLIEGLAAGACEQHPDTWWDAVRAVVRELVSAPGVSARNIRALGVSGQQHGFVPLDAEGRVLRPAKLWCDTATAEEASELARRWGRPVPTGYTASKILWMKRHEPERFARLAHALLPHEWLNWRLTDAFGAEAGDASGTGFFDPERARVPARRLRAARRALGRMLAAVARARHARRTRHRPAQPASWASQRAPSSRPAAATTC